jgi:hypothetical protein
MVSAAHRLVGIRPRRQFATGFIEPSTARFVDKSARFAEREQT